MRLRILSLFLFLIVGYLVGLAAHVVVKKTNLQYENALPLLLMGADERQKTLLSNVFFPAAQVSKLQMEEEKGQAVVDVSLEAKSNRYANVSGKRLFVKLNPLKANSENVASVDKRLSPIFLNAVFCDEDDIEVVLPDGYQVESMPKGYGNLQPVCLFQRHLSERRRYCLCPLSVDNERGDFLCRSDG